MLTPQPHAPRSRSFKEDGELGETAQDVICRQEVLSPGERKLINNLRKYEDMPELFTPEVVKAVGQMLSRPPSRPWPTS